MDMQKLNDLYEKLHEFYHELDDILKEARIDKHVTYCESVAMLQHDINNCANAIADFQEYQMEVNEDELAYSK